MVSIAQLGIRSFQFLFTLLTMALIGNVIAEAFGGNPSSINYAMFTSVFDMLVVLAAFAAIFLEALAIPIVWMVLDGLALLFTFICAVVLAAKLHVHSCSNDAYTAGNSLTNGSANREKRCREIQASTAFFWFLFASFVGSLILSVMSSRGSSSMRGRGGIRKGGPSMSQV